ncbi:hypothetical protein HanIR_Chr04g0150411 [Helianthus annuus]|nr:hypothetical protein HanIR_Chr04g0150411 [Helianthus annuus]
MCVQLKLYRLCNCCEIFKTIRLHFFKHNFLTRSVQSFLTQLLHSARYDVFCEY